MSPGKGLLAAAGKVLGVPNNVRKQENISLLKQEQRMTLKAFLNGYIVFTPVPTNYRLQEEFVAPLVIGFF